MAINKKLIHFKTKAAFTTELNAGNILDTSIVFIKDTKEIWTHGQLYSCSLTEEEVISIIENSNSISNLTSTLNNKVDKVPGKSLVDDTEIDKLSNLPNKADLDSAIADAKKTGTDAQTNLTAHIDNKENPHEVTKEQVGLGNVTNEAQIPLSQKGAASGVATLGTDGKLTAAQLPAMKTVNGVSVVGSGNISIDLSLYKVVDTLPTTSIDATKIYIVPAKTTGDKNIKAEYVYTGDPASTYDATKWEKLGDAQTNIVVDAELNADSTNPIQNKAVKSTIDTLKQSITDVENKNIAQDLALAKKLDKTDYVIDADLSEISTNPVQNKAVKSALDSKVDKVEGKLLSTNDYTTAEKNKVNESINESAANTLINTAIGKLTKASVGLDNVDNIADTNKEVKSATKLKTARTLWGLTFDGTTNISGNLTDVTEVYTTDGSKYAEPCTSDDIKALFA